MKPEQGTQLGQLLKARREACGLSTHRLAAAADMDQATIVRLEAGTIRAPRPDKLSRIAQVLGISGADVFALAGYAVPSDLPSLRAYLSAKYGGLQVADIDKIETYVARLAKKRGFALVDTTTISVGPCGEYQLKRKGVSDDSTRQSHGRR